MKWKINWSTTPLSAIFLRIQFPFKRYKNNEAKNYSTEKVCFRPGRCPFRGVCDEICRKAKRQGNKKGRKEEIQKMKSRPELVGRIVNWGFLLLTELFAPWRKKWWKVSRNRGEGIINHLLVVCFRKKTVNRRRKDEAARGERERCNWRRSLFSKRRKTMNFRAVWLVRKGIVEKVNKRNTDEEEMLQWKTWKGNTNMFRY